MQRRVVQILAALAGAFVAGMAGAQGALQKITMLHSQPVITATFAYSSSLPVHLGYFREEGLDVEVNAMAGASQAMQMVESPSLVTR